MPNTWAENNIAVIYPEVSEPYLSVFQTILKGIKSQPGNQVLPLALPQNHTPEAIEEWLHRNEADTIIALGNRSYFLAKKLHNNFPVVAGALLMTPEGLPGVSLTPAPQKLFSHLRALAPNIRRVYAVYNPEMNDWLIKLAEKAAQKNGLELVSSPANDLRSAMSTYQKIVRNINRRTDAIWLPLDKFASNEQVVLPMLLQAAWKKGFIIFSSKPTHAKRGVLFSLYPDHFKLGQKLEAMAKEHMNTDEMTKVLPMQDLHIAVNLRTASHLGIDFSSKQRSTFHLTFPSH